MKNGNLNAFPVVLNNEIHSDGLTKRELIAAMAMQGALASTEFQTHRIAEEAVRQADELLAELEKTKP